MNSTQRRANILKTIRFEGPEYIPMVFHINGACWQHYPHHALLELISDHPFLFPDFIPTQEVISPDHSPVQRKDTPYTDPWGCIWNTSEDGITGTVVEYPLADWADFAQLQIPDPEKTDGLIAIDWDTIAKDIENKKTIGEFTHAGLRHGHSFLQLCDIRGYQSVMYDMYDDESHLQPLIEMIEAFNLAIIEHYIRLGVDMMIYPEDLGMQLGPMLSPDHFRKYIQPSYERLMRPAREAGCIIHMHSDGDIRLLVDDMVESGVQVINLQDLVNGIDWIADRFAGKVCIDLDIDRQKITPYGTPAEIDALIREEVEALGSRDGGLMLIYGLYPGVPLENVRALMDAMENYATYYR